MNTRLTAEEAFLKARKNELNYILNEIQKRVNQGRTEITIHGDEERQNRVHVNFIETVKHLKDLGYTIKYNLWTDKQKLENQTEEEVFEIIKNNIGSFISWGKNPYIGNSAVLFSRTYQRDPIELFEIITNK